MRTRERLVEGQRIDQRSGERRTQLNERSDLRSETTGKGDVSPHQTGGFSKGDDRRVIMFQGRNSESALFKGQSKSTSFLKVESSVSNLNSILPSFVRLSSFAIC